MRTQFDRKKKIASMGLVAGFLLYLAFFSERLYSDWVLLVQSLFTPSVSGLALLIALARYVLIGGEAGTMLKGAIFTIAVIFGIGILMGWVMVV